MRSKQIRHLRRCRLRRSDAAAFGSARRRAAGLASSVPCRCLKKLGASSTGARQPDSIVLRVQNHHQALFLAELVKALHYRVGLEAAEVLTPARAAARLEMSDFERPPEYLRVRASRYWRSGAPHCYYQPLLALFSRFRMVEGCSCRTARINSNRRSQN